MLASRLHHEDTGPTASGSAPLLLLHGLLGSAATWEAQAHALAPARRVLRVDLPGHGQSAPVRGPVAIADLAADVLSLVERLGLERIVVGGLSLGGRVALEIAAAAPARTTALVLASTDPRAETEASRQRHRAALALATRLGPGPLRRGIAAQAFGATTRARRPALVERWLAATASHDLDAALPLVEAGLRRDDAAARLAEVRCPALVLHGAEDRLVPLDASESMARGLRRGALVVVAEAGHNAPLEQPDAVSSALATFLAGLA